MVQMSNCPECDVIAVFEPVGSYRALCTHCGAMVKNEELTQRGGEGRVQEADLT